MKIKVLFFAEWAEVFKERERVMDVKPGMKAGELAGLLLKDIREDNLKNIPCRYIVNEKFVSEDQVLVPDDSFVMISPVQGG